MKVGVGLAEKCPTCERTGPRFTPYFAWVAAIMLWVGMVTGSLRLVGWVVEAAS